jgi:hypothetical protein
VKKSIRMIWARHVVHMGEKRGVHRVLVGKPAGKRPLGRPRRRWKDNITMDLQEVGVLEYGLDRAISGQGQALVNAVMNRRVPYNAGKFLTS